MRAIWEQLDSIAQRAISTAYHNVGEFDARAFVAQYGDLPPRPQKEGSWYGYCGKEPVLFDLFVPDGQIPDDLMPLLADVVLPPERFQLEGVKKLPKIIKYNQYDWDVTSVDTEMIGRADLLTFLQMVEQKQVKFGFNNRRLTASSVRKLMANLLDGDFQELPEKVTGRTVIRPFGLDLFSQESSLMDLVHEDKVLAGLC